MTNHLKRLAVPNTWKIPKKTHKWAIKPSVGGHPLERSIPLAILIRDMLGYCDSYREARRIIGNGDLLIDGRISKDFKRGIGIMDVISIPKIKENYLVLLDSRGKLRVKKISSNEAKWKLVRIENKTTIKKGKTQLNFHDGRNLLIEKDLYKTGDVIKLGIPEPKIIETYNLKENYIAMIIGGKHAGEIAPVKSVEITISPKPNLVHFEKFSTIKDYVFVVGTNVPVISVMEE